MKITYRLLTIILICTITPLFIFNQFHKKQQMSPTKFNTPPNLNFIKENYDDLITSKESPAFIRAMYENGFVCYHAGLLFPWDSNQAQQNDLTDLTTAWHFAQRLELNRDYYGFLFLNNPTQETRILDAGCSGGTSSILMDQVFNCYVDGYSLAKKEIEHAKATAAAHHSSDKLHFWQGNILQLPEKDNTYDAIWIGEVSEYIPSISNLFTEMKRVGKNNTRVIIFAWCAIKDAGKKLMDELYGSSLHKIEEYISAGKQHNFKLIHKQNLRDWVTPYWKIITKAGLYSYENHLAQAYLSGDLDYYLLCFDIQK